VTGERPDGVTWQSTAGMRCIGGAPAAPGMPLPSA
jgi:hypothetical protein